MVVAGDADLVSDNQGHQRVRNSVAHTPGPISTAAAALNADQPEMTKVTSTAEIQNLKESSATTYKQVPSSKGLPGGLPGGPEGAEEVVEGEDRWWGRQCSKAKTPAPLLKMSTQIKLWFDSRRSGKHQGARDREREPQEHLCHRGAPRSSMAIWGKSVEEKLGQAQMQGKARWCVKETKGKPGGFK